MKLTMIVNIGDNEGDNEGEYLWCQCSCMFEKMMFAGGSAKVVKRLTSRYGVRLTGAQ